MFPFIEKNETEILESLSIFWGQKKNNNNNI